MLPKFQTMLESGYPQFGNSGCFGVYLLPQLPLPIVDLIGGTINAALKTIEKRQGLARPDADAVGGSPANFPAFLQRDVRTLSKQICDERIVAN